MKKTEKKLIKLHKQFGHASSSNLLNLMKNAEVDTKNISKIVEKVTEQCNICKLHKKLLPRLAVSIPKSSKSVKILTKWLQWIFINSMIIFGIYIS